MIRHESIITALLGAAMGIGAGLGLAAAVTSVFADEGLRFAVPAGPPPPPARRRSLRLIVGAADADPAEARLLVGAQRALQPGEGAEHHVAQPERPGTPPTVSRAARRADAGGGRR